jgi:peptidoglycan hydrolase CwlO-like protein
MLKKTSIAIAALTLILSFGCKQKSSTENAGSTPTQPVAAQSASQDLTPEQLGEIGAQIKKHPSDATKILSEHGLTEATFEKEIRRVASDPDASRRYRDAYNKNV